MRDQLRGIQTLLDLSVASKVLDSIDLVFEE